MPDESTPPDVSPQHPTRRDVVRAAALAVAAPVLAPLAACAPSAAPAPAPAPAAAAPVAAPGAPVAPSAPPQRQGQQPPDPVAVHLTEALKAKYRERLTDEQWEEVRRQVEGNLRGARQLREFALPITTEPAFVFRAYRGGGR